MTMLVRALIVAATALAAVVASSFTSTAHAQVVDFSKYPDFSGQWKRPDGVGIQWDQSKPLGKQQAPLTPEYQARYEVNLADQALGGQGDDKTGQCIPHGMPRVMTVVYPMEIVIMPKATYILTDYTVPRRIFTDGRDWPKEIEPTFQGYSIGKWIDTDGDGKYDVLEVETRGFKGPRINEIRGLPLHRDNQSVFKERFYLDKNDPNLLHDEITVIDNALTRPWTVDKRYVRNPDLHAEWPESICPEYNANVVIGGENFFLSADGLLMPSRKGQLPPDVRYFDKRRE